jgi:hypothetical protein
MVIGAEREVMRARADIHSDRIKGEAEFVERAPGHPAVCTDYRSGQGGPGGAHTRPVCNAHSREEDV